MDVFCGFGSLSFFAKYNLDAEALQSIVFYKYHLF